MLNITAHGNLGKDPEIREVNDMHVASFSLAANTGKDETTWINCSVWGKRAETVINYLHKGDKITVVGNGKVRIYEHNGKEGQSLELRVSDFTLPPKKEDAPKSTGNIDF